MSLFLSKSYNHATLQLTFSFISIPHLQQCYWSGDIVFISIQLLQSCYHATNRHLATTDIFFVYSILTIMLPCNWSSSLFLFHTCNNATDQLTLCISRLNPYIMLPCNWSSSLSLFLTCNNATDQVTLSLSLFNS